MKKFATLAVMVIFGGLLVSASYAQAAGPKTGPPGTTNGANQQGQKPGDVKKGPMVAFKEAVEKLDLSDDQKKKLKDIQADMQKKQKELREEVKAGKVDKKDVRTKTADLMKGFIADVKGVLTTEQWKKVETALPKAEQVKGKKKGGGL